MKSNGIGAGGARRLTYGTIVRGYRTNTQNLHFYIALIRCGVTSGLERQVFVLWTYLKTYFEHSRSPSEDKTVA